ncbi:MAG: hypothetical protein DMG06_23850 [Acidobacteria bacterium]|nr:MAG: hypothetical protein DMG06_23850 [Acidobacteriota bacterium]
MAFETAHEVANDIVDASLRVHRAFTKIPCNKLLLYIFISPVLQRGVREASHSLHLSSRRRWIQRRRLERWKKSKPSKKSPR